MINLFTNLFNWWAPTGLGMKYVPNSLQPALYDYIVTQRSLRGEELKTFHNSIMDSDGYMNTDKTKKYANNNGITLLSNIFDFNKKDK